MFRKRFFDALEWRAHVTVEENEFKLKRKRPIWSCVAVKDFRFFFSLSSSFICGTTTAQSSATLCQNCDGKMQTQSYIGSQPFWVVIANFYHHEKRHIFFSFGCYRFEYSILSEWARWANFRQFQFESQQRANYYHCLASVPPNIRAETQFVYACKRDWNGLHAARNVWYWIQNFKFTLPFVLSRARRPGN